jgi:hypothetical protein
MFLDLIPWDAVGQVEFTDSLIRVLAQRRNQPALKLQVHLPNRRQGNRSLLASGSVVPGKRLDVKLRVGRGIGPG